MKLMNVVFDFGAVLFAWHPRTLVAQAFPLEAATASQATALASAFFAHPDWLSFDRGTLAMDSVIDRTAKRLQLAPSAVATLVENIGEYLQPMAESIAVLKKLQQRKDSVNLRLFYLSNMSVPYARTLERKFDFMTWFDGGIFSGDVHLVKPETGIYALLENRYALQPDQTIFIDDMKGNVEAARQRGWLGIHFESALQLQAELRPLLT